MTAHAGGALSVGEPIPEIHRTPEVIDMVLYSGVLWATHKIHYDEGYSKSEGYADMLVHAPLQGAYLSQLITEWIGDRGMLAYLKYRNVSPAPIGGTLTIGGSITRVDLEGSEVECEVWVRKADGNRSCEGVARVRWLGSD